MNRNDSLKYCVIQFLDVPFKGIDEYVCIPSSWIRLRVVADRRAIVSYPVENTRDTERRVKQMQRLSEDWGIYMAAVKYETDFYNDAQVFINEQIDNLQCEKETSNSKKGDHELSRTKTHESKPEDNLNHKMAVPQEFKILKNYKSPTKIRLKRVKNITLFGSIEPPESNSEGELSSSEALESSKYENSCTQEIPVEKPNYDKRVEETTDPKATIDNTPTGIKNSSNLYNPSLHPGTIATNNFITGFFKFLRDLPPSFRDIEKLSTAFDKDPEKTKEILKSVISLRTPNNNITTASTLKDTPAEVTKICGRKRNAATEKDDDDNDVGDGKDQIPKKKLSYQSKFVLPPEYDENDSRWTLKYRTSAPGLVELMPHTGVYINAVKLSQCKRLATDCNALARVLTLAIFKSSALRTCSLTGLRAKAYDLFGEYVRPGLDENARKVILEFVKQYGSTKGWETSNTKSILASIRNKMRDLRRKHN